MNCLNGSRIDAAKALGFKEILRDLSLLEIADVGLRCPHQFGQGLLSNTLELSQEAQPARFMSLDGMPPSPV